MNFPTKFVVAKIFLCLAVIARVNGAASFDPFVFCADVVPVNIDSFYVCAGGSYTSPSPAMYPNGTVVYTGGYSATYTIVKGLREGVAYLDFPDAEVGIKIVVGRDDFDECKVSVTLKDEDAITCKSCSYCGKLRYKADCTNVKNGRKLTTCEKADEDVIFFPLFENAISAVKAPVRAPVKFLPVQPAPRRAPARAPVRAPLVAPVRAPVKLPAPVRAPLVSPVRAPVKAQPVPRRTPVRASLQAPIRAPVVATIKAEVQSPMRAPRRTPVRPPMRAPARAPVTTQVKAPVQPELKVPVKKPIVKK
jgi:hypothetical protein